MARERITQWSRPGGAGLVGAAWLAYTHGELEEACVLYEKVLTFVDSPVHAYALYRRAWCDRVESPERAQEGFRRAIAAAEEGRGGTPAEARVVRAAARLDLERAVTR